LRRLWIPSETPRGGQDAQFWSRIWRGKTRDVTARAEAEQKRAEADQKRAEAEQKRAEADQKRAEAEQKRAKAEQKRADVAYFSRLGGEVSAAGVGGGWDAGGEAGGGDVSHLAELRGCDRKWAMGREMPTAAAVIARVRGSIVREGVADAVNRNAVEKRLYGKERDDGIFERDTAAAAAAAAASSSSHNT
jgi:Sec-independent protein translocase protein TatA